MQILRAFLKCFIIIIKSIRGRQSLCSPRDVSAFSYIYKDTFLKEVSFFI